MKFLTILATVFCGGTFFVGADYYLEFRALSTAAPSSSSARAQPTMESFMYECKGHPAGRSAFASDLSRCTLVNPSAQKGIHATHTFFSVWGVNLGGHVIHLSDRGIIPDNIVWMLGYKNDAIDHPNFAEPSLETLGYLQARVEEMSLNNAVPSSMFPVLAQYFAVTNLISFSRSPFVAKRQLAMFASFLNRVVDKSSRIHMENNPERAASLRTQITLAFQVSLQKMIDPCSVLLGTLQSLATRYCGNYCKFLGVAAGYYGSGATMLGGHCEGVVCTCFQIVRTPLAGCHYSQMRERDNAMRMNLLDSWSGPRK